jgi:hypothetical protein
MNDSTHIDAPVYLLPAKSYQSLWELHNLMFLMASISYASTREEERIPLRMPRSLLAQRLQMFAAQLADALDATQPLSHVDDDVQRTH